MRIELQLTIYSPTNTHQVIDFIENITIKFLWEIISLISSILKGYEFPQTMNSMELENIS